MRTRPVNKSLQRVRIAKERIKKLFDLAKEELNKPERSRSYVELARKIGKRYNVRLTKEEKRSFCRKCSQLLIPTRTSKVNIDTKKKIIIIKCMNCGNIYKYPYKRG